MLLLWQENHIYFNSSTWELGHYLAVFWILMEDHFLASLYREEKVTFPQDIFMDGIFTSTSVCVRATWGYFHWSFVLEHKILRNLSRHMQYAKITDVIDSVRAKIPEIFS